MMPSEKTVELYSQLQRIGVNLSIEYEQLRIDGAKKLSPSQISLLKAKKAEFMHLVNKRKEMTDTIKAYTNAVKRLYKDNAHILQWIKSYHDQQNTMEPLMTVQNRFREAKREVERYLTVDSLHKLDYELSELESVFLTLSSIYDETKRSL